MDLGTLIGLIVAFGFMLFAIFMAPGASLWAFYDLPSIAVVFGGGLAVVMVCFPLKNALGLPAVLKLVFFNKQSNIPELIEQLVGLGETARRDGLLALEGKVEQIDNRFIKLGIQMAVDGTRPEVIEDILKTEMEAVHNRHRDGKALVDMAGKFFPAFGMIGTLMGLILMLGNMSDPSSIGSGMAVALITTLYGAIASNAVFLPFSEKLNYLNRQELISMDIIMRGIMAIQSGESPRVIQQKLSTFLAPKLRAGAKEAA
jgi:chemotaxis protein MotA